MITDQTVIEINLNSLKNNLNFIKSILRPKTMIMAVVKAHSYGGDSLIISKELEKQKIDYLAVAYTNEGIFLRNSGIKTPILVLHPQINDFEDLISHELEPSIYSFRILDAFLSQKNRKKNYPFQLKFNTGLNRLGFSLEEIDTLVSMLGKDVPNFIFSHLGASEDLKNTDFTKKQLEMFKVISKKIELKIGKKIKKHILNTSGILNFSNFQYEMVRSGIGLYGFGNDKRFSNNLTPVLSLKTVISQIHHVKKGDSVGYNLGYIAKKQTRIATLPIGHADGISRSCGNGKIHVLINGQKVKTIGNICMDMMMVDITTALCEEGDEVIIFDDKNISVEQLSNSVDTISYEILASLSKRISRKIIYSKLNT